MSKLTVYENSNDLPVWKLLIGYAKVQNIELEVTKEPTQTSLFLKDSNETFTLQAVIVTKLVAASPAADLLLPSDHTRRAAVDSWIDYAVQKDFGIYDKQFLKELDEHLLDFTFFVGNCITCADLVIFASLQNYMRLAKSSEKLKFGNLCRWYDHVQHLPGILDNSDNAVPVSFEKDMQLVNDMLAETKLVKKEKTKAAQKRTGNAAEDKSRPVDDVTRLNVRVGFVEHVERHPEAEKLYCLKINLGEGSPRDICSGLVPFLPPEEILEKKVCVVANMKPKSLRGKPSNGMVLCVSSEDRTTIELLQPPHDATVNSSGNVCMQQIGERVEWEGYSGEPDIVMNTKTGKDPFVAVQPHFVCKDRVGYFKDAKFKTTKGPCTCKSLTSGTIS